MSEVKEAKTESQPVRKGQDSDDSACKNEHSQSQAETPAIAMVTATDSSNDEPSSPKSGINNVTVSCAKTTEGAQVSKDNDGAEGSNFQQSLALGVQIENTGQPAPETETDATEEEGGAISTSADVNIKISTQDNDATVQALHVQTQSKLSLADTNQSTSQVSTINTQPVTLATAEAGDNDEVQDHDDDASSAAMAMAALAAAASANNLSPSAAAKAARALAPGLTNDPRNHVVTTVRLSSVKAQLMRKILASSRASANANAILSDDDTETINVQAEIGNVQQRIANGDNDFFLRHMLLLQYMTSLNEDTAMDSPPDAATNENTNKLPDLEDARSPQNQSFESAEKVHWMIHMAEEAYDAMAGLLPKLTKEDERIISDDDSTEFYGMEMHSIVPDLLPPCTSPMGDATLQFFRACQGEQQGAPAPTESAVTQQSPQQIANDANAPTIPVVVAEPATTEKPPASMFSTMFSSMTRKAVPSPARQPASLTGVFRKRTRPEPGSGVVDAQPVFVSKADSSLSNGEYCVSIDREMLGLTVENVLERTVVRTVLAGGAAKKAGAKVGSLIVRVGNVETRNLTHFETIDELRQSQRPLKLVLRQISSDALRSAREEMGRLIRGGGFGSSLHSESSESVDNPQNIPVRRTHHSKPANAEAFSQVLHQRWNKENANHSNKQLALVHAGEKLVWILSLLVIGLEREAAESPPKDAFNTSFEDSSTRRSHSLHMSEDYADASKSVSKVLFDFASEVLSWQTNSQHEKNLSHATGTPLRIGLNAVQSIAPSHVHDKNLLLRIGDVLHRTRTFLADPASPPAALLRGEVISFLCDILDLDTDMILSEEEAGSVVSTANAGSISDLGSAGSLLKLIILNCSMMRSPGCTSFASSANNEVADVEEEQRRRFGGSKATETVDLHRFHAGNRFLAVVHRLAASRSVSARITACSLGPVLWGHLDFPHQLQLRGVITRALHDVDLMVRKSTATVLHEIAELVFDPRAVPWLVLMCERAMTDPDPQLRAAAMTLTWHLSDHLPNAFLGDARQGSRSLRRLPPRTDPTFAEVYLLQCKLLPVATRLAEDRAPSVRLAVAAQCDRLCSSLGEHWYSVIIDVLQALLGDLDENVRREAILCVPRFAEIVLVSSQQNGGVGVLEALLPITVKLARDPSINVRVALATAAGDLLTLLVGLQSLQQISPHAMGEPEAKAGATKNTKHVDGTLIPLLQNLLQDSEPEVTSAALRAVTNASRGSVRELKSRKDSRVLDDDTLSLSSYQSHMSGEKKDPVFIPVLSEEQVLRLLPTLSDLANNRQWRVRQGAVEIVPALLGCTKKLEIRSEVAQLCFRLMNDKVDAVRRTAAECLCLSGGGLGGHGDESGRQWIENVVIPHVRLCSKSNMAKQRMLSLKMMEVIILNNLCSTRARSSRTTSSSEVGKSAPREMIEIAVALSADRVANVRLNFGRLICVVLTALDEAEILLVSKALQEQIESEKLRERGGDRDVLFFAKRALGKLREKDDMSLPSIH